MNTGGASGLNLNCYSGVCAAWDVFPQPGTILAERPMTDCPWLCESDGGGSEEPCPWKELADKSFSPFR